MRRYGSHGPSCLWARDRADEMLGRSLDDLAMMTVDARVPAPYHKGASIWPSMGITSLKGAIRVGRNGSLDPGALLWLQTEHGLSPEDLRPRLST